MLTKMALWRVTSELGYSVYVLADNAEEAIKRGISVLTNSCFFPLDHSNHAQQRVREVALQYNGHNCIEVFTDVPAATSPSK